MVANFIPPAYDLSNLMPDKINFRIGGLITAGFGFRNWWIVGSGYYSNGFISIC